MFVECRHIKPRGTKCGSPALKGRPYCYYHDQLHTYTQDGRRDDNDKTFCLPSIEDASGIQLALTQVMNAMANHRLDSREGVRLIYGMQVALQALAHIAPTPPQEIVQATACDGIGVDITLPDEDQCQPHAECATCTNRFGCQNVRRQSKKSIRDLCDEGRDQRERADREPLALPAGDTTATEEKEPSPIGPVLVSGQEHDPLPASTCPSPTLSPCSAWEPDPLQPRTESVDPQKEAEIEARINKFRPSKKEADRVAREEEIYRMQSMREITPEYMCKLLDHPELPLPSSPSRKKKGDG